MSQILLSQSLLCTCGGPEQWKHLWFVFIVSVPVCRVSIGPDRPCLIRSPRWPDRQRPKMNRHVIKNQGENRLELQVDLNAEAGIFILIVSWWILVSPDRQLTERNDSQYELWLRGRNRHALDLSLPSLFYWIQRNMRRTIDNHLAKRWLTFQPSPEEHR